MLHICKEQNTGQFAHIKEANKEIRHTAIRYLINHVGYSKF